MRVEAKKKGQGRLRSESIKLNCGSDVFLHGLSGPKRAPPQPASFCQRAAQFSPAPPSHEPWLAVGFIFLFTVLAISRLAAACTPAL